MKQIIFILKSAWLSVASKKLLSGIVIASVALGMLFPISVLSQINYRVKNFSNPFYNDIEHTAVLDCFIETHDTETMKTMLTPPDSNIKNIGFFAAYSTTMVFEGESWISFVAAYEPEYMKIGRTELLSGRFLTDEELSEGAKVCLCAESDRVGKKERLGDFITIGGTDFEIVGIIRDRKLYGGTMIPYNSLLKMTNAKDLQYKVYLQSDGELDMDAIKVFVRKNDEFIKTIDSMSVRSAVECQEDLVNRVTVIFKRNMLVGSIITLFSIISFTLIIIGKVINEQYVMGVKTAMGATKGQLFIDLILQNFILIQIAAIIAMALSQVVISLLPGLNGLFGSAVIAATEALVAVLTLLITTTAFIPFIRKPVAEMFRSSN